MTRGETGERGADSSPTTGEPVGLPSGRSEPTDAELIARAQLDVEAFTEVYRRHVLVVHSFLRARTPADVAAELTAETFAQSLVALGRFRDQASGSARPWLLGIARNLARKYHEREAIDRRARRRLAMPIETYTIDDDHDRALDRKAAALSTLSALPREQEQAIRLRVIDELPYREVAARLHISEVAARLRVMRGLRALAQAVRSAKGAPEDR